MTDHHDLSTENPELIREMLLGSGYAEKAIDYYLRREHMGSLPDANQISELTGQCGDTMKIFLKIKDNIIQEAKIQVLGCPGAIASAMAAMEMVKGKSVEEAAAIKDGDVYKIIEQLPDQKQHCIRLSIKTLQQALDEYTAKKEPHPEG